MLSITCGQTNKIDFELSLSGDVGPEVDVVLTVCTQAVSYRFTATRSGNACVVVVPDYVQIPSGEYDLFVDVYMDSHVYPAVQDKIEIKQALKPTVQFSQTKAPPVAPPATVTMSVTKQPSPVPSGLKGRIMQVESLEQRSTNAKA
jgi:hypothetical protein